MSPEQELGYEFRTRGATGSVDGLWADANAHLSAGQYGLHSNALQDIARLHCAAGSYADALDAMLAVSFLQSNGPTNGRGWAPRGWTLPTGLVRRVDLLRLVLAWEDEAVAARLAELGTAYRRLSPPIHPGTAANELLGELWRLRSRA